MMGIVCKPEHEANGFGQSGASTSRPRFTELSEAFKGVHMSTVSMPEREASYLEECYSRASVILEYGSGNSTLLAAKFSGKRIYSVESDERWAEKLKLDPVILKSSCSVCIHYVNIGPTGPWGRVLDDSSWRTYHRYPNSVWELIAEDEPDLILIDGRFRTACFISALLHIRKPTVVLFDDYSTRPKYRNVERLVQPSKIVGRMARFDVAPGLLKASDMSFAIGEFFSVSVHGDKGSYEMNPEPPKITS